MIPVKPEILIWARETAGLTLQEAASKINVTDSSLKKMEQGNKDPSYSILVRMAKCYQRPLVTFYLNYIPRESEYGSDFRGLSDQTTSREKSLIETLLRHAKASQQMIRATLEVEEECIPLPFVGWLTKKWELPQESDSLGQMLKQMNSDQRKAITQDAFQGIEQILGDRDIRTEYYRQRDPTSAFKLLRSNCEDSGIFIVLKKNSGGPQNKLPPNLFRAFVIADEIAPFVVINSGDSKSAQSFSLIHELIHLLLGQTGISDLEHTDSIEQFCNRIAGQWLLPSEQIERVRNNLPDDVSEINKISHISKQCNLSRLMVATRFFQERHISHNSYQRLKQSYAEEWENSQQRPITSRESSSSGGPSPYVIWRSELGNGMIQFVRRMIQSDNLSVSKAAIILSVKPSHVHKLINP